MIRLNPNDPSTWPMPGDFDDEGRIVVFNELGSMAFNRRDYPGYLDYLDLLNDLVRDYHSWSHTEQFRQQGRPRKYTDDEILSAYKRSTSYEAAAKSLGCSRSTVVAAMRRIKERGM